MPENTTLTLPDTDELRNQTAPVYHRFKSETEPQPAFLHLYPETGQLMVGYSCSIGGAIPIEVLRDRELRYAIPAKISGEELANLLNDVNVQILFQRIIDGHSVEFDGDLSSDVGILDDGAEGAEAELLSILENLDDPAFLVDVFPVGDWLFALPTTTVLEYWQGCPLEDAIAALEAEAKTAKAIIDGSIKEALLHAALEIEEGQRDEHHTTALRAAGLLEDAAA